MSRESDNASPTPRGAGGAYPSGTPPYGTGEGASRPGQQRESAKEDSARTETTLTTRFRINIPGSRPIPPVVVRETMRPSGGGTAGSAGSDGGEGAAPRGAEDLAPGADGGATGNERTRETELPSEWPSSPSASAAAPAEQTSSFPAPAAPAQPAAPTPPTGPGSGTSVSPYAGAGASGDTSSGLPVRRPGDGQSARRGSQGSGAGDSSEGDGGWFRPRKRAAETSEPPSAAAASAGAAAATGLPSRPGGAGAPPSAPSSPASPFPPSAGSGAGERSDAGQPGAGTGPDAGDTGGLPRRGEGAASASASAAPSFPADGGAAPSAADGPKPPPGQGRSHPLGQAAALGRPNPGAGPRLTGEATTDARRGMGPAGPSGESTVESTAPFPAFGANLAAEAPTAPAASPAAPPAPPTSPAAPGGGTSPFADSPFTGSPFGAFPPTPPPPPPGAGGSPFAAAAAQPPVADGPVPDGFAGGTGGIGEGAQKSDDKSPLPPEPKPTPAPTSSAVKAIRGLRGPVKKGVYAVGGLVLVGGVAYGAGLMLDQADIPNGTTVMGVNIGGDSRDAAVHTLDDTVGKSSQEPLTLSIDGRTVSLNPSVAGLTIDTTATVQGISQHDYNPVAVIGGLFGGKHAVAPTVVVDQQKLRAALQQLAGSGGSGAGSSGAMTEGAVLFKFEGGMAKAVPVMPKSGQGIDVNTAAAAVQAAYQERAQGASPGTVTLPVGNAQPKATPAAVQQAADTIGKWATSGLFHVQAGSVKVPFGPHTFSMALTLQPDASGKLVPTFDAAKLAAAYGTQFAGAKTKSGGAVTTQDVITALTTLLSHPNGPTSIMI